jgi:hypothetical protein
MTKIMDRLSINFDFSFNIKNYLEREAEEPSMSSYASVVDEELGIYPLSSST